MSESESKSETETGVAAIGGTNPDLGQLEACYTVMARVDEQLRFADSKVGFVASLHAFLIGPLASNVAAIRGVIEQWSLGARVLLWVVAGIYTGLFLVSMTIVTMTVLPRYRKTSKRPSKAFFGRIAKEFGHAPDLYIAELRRMSDKDWLAEVGQYIVDVSNIAATKHKLARWATLVTVPTVLFWLLLVLVLLYAR
jgi:hypothetical protein